MPNHGDAFLFLEEEGARIFGAVSSMLYVGHQACTSPWWHRTFAPLVGARRIAVLDVDRPNLMTAERITSELYLGDVRQSDRPSGFGLVFWDEGPEHLPRDEALYTISRMAAENGRVLTSTPWGYQPQGDDPTLPDYHHWGPMPADFESIGMHARTFGTMFDGLGRGCTHGHGNLIAWTR